MDLQTRKIEFIQEFLKIQREDIVIRLEKALKKETAKVKSEEIAPFSIDEFHERINQSASDFEQNRLTDSNDLLSEIHKWH